jgi:serine/threonine protein phosphatase 1
VAAAQVPDLAPDGIVSVVGDVHGCDARLARLLAGLPGQIVLVGDLIDRGDQSAAVIDRMMGRPDIISLMGNHEEMLLDFLDDPELAGRRWLRNGGLQTLASFRVSGDLTAAGLPRLRDGLAQALGAERTQWLRDRPLFWTSGNLAVTHAGPDPLLPLAEQHEQLLWGHPACGRAPRGDGLWIAHGHQVVDRPQVAGGVIRMDTGAYAGGPLTAAVIGDGPVRFVAEG